MAWQEQKVKPLESNEICARTWDGISKEEKRRATPSARNRNFGYPIAVKLGSTCLWTLGGKKGEKKRTIHRISKYREFRRVPIFDIED